MQAINIRLDQLIRARYPLIAILSNEERRVQRTVRQIAEAQKKRVIAWTVTSGFKALDEQSTPLAGSAQNDPIGALQAIGSDDTPRTIFVVKDLHPFLQDPVVTRALRDLAQSLSETTK